MRKSVVLAAIWAMLIWPAAESAAAQDQQAYSIRQVLSSPFPSSLTTAPSGSRLAWIFNSQGIRNVWAAEGPDFKARRLTHFDRDDGRELSIVGFTPDGGQLVFGRDGRFNPDHQPGGGGGNKLYAVGWSSAEVLEIGPYSGAAAISPTDGRVAYAEGGAVWVVNVEEKGKPVRLLTARGDLSQLSWSPASPGRLLMRSLRGQFPHQYSYILLFDAEQGSFRYLDPSIYLDSSPVFSPDGRRVAFLRRFVSDHRSGLTERSLWRPDPWAIQVTELASERTVTVWTSPPEDTFASADVAWLDNEHLVFTSEHEGWRHLYIVSADGREIRKLTAGSAEVEGFQILPGQGKVFFTSNAGDVDRRHLWMATHNEAARQLTSGDAIEWNPVPTADGNFLAAFGSNARHPAHVYVRPLGGGPAVKLAPEALPSNFPSDRMVVPRPVMLQPADGLTVHGQLFKPPPEFQGRRPAVLFFHGGPVRQMLLGWHYRSYYHHAYALNQYLASRGFVVLSVNFRLGIGYGREFRDVRDGGPRGGSEYQDLLAGARYLRGLTEVDPERIGLWGGSYGGLMTALGLARNSDLFAAGVDFHGVHDWNQWQAWAGRGENDNNRAAWKSSPVADLDSWRSPVLLIHGDDDRNVPYSETVWLAKELKSRGVEVELLVLPDEVHGFLLHESWLRTYEAAAEFLQRRLGERVR